MQAVLQEGVPFCETAYCFNKPIIPQDVANIQHISFIFICVQKVHLFDDRRDAEESA